MFAESKYNEASQKLRTLQQNEYEIGRKHDELQRKQMAAESEKNELSEMMQRKNREVDRLQRSEDRVSFWNFAITCVLYQAFKFQGELNGMTSEMEEAKRAKIEAITQRDQMQADMLKMEVHYTPCFYLFQIIRLVFIYFCDFQTPSFYL